MTYNELFYNSKGEPAKKEITVIGMNPLIEFFLQNTRFLADLLKVNTELKIKLIYENDTENFNQALVYSKEYSKSRTDVNKLIRNKKNLLGSKDEHKGGLVDLVLDHFNESEKAAVSSRITLLQNNLRHFANIIKADDVIRYCFTTLEIPTADYYVQVKESSNSAIYNQLNDYIEYLSEEKAGGLFLSEDGEELIELYDKDNYRRGIYPRKAFYTTNYKRYSIWAFIFNRKGELLLHQRSEFTADNRSLWDKSAGGHVDLKDSSTIITAKREVVEELFLPEAEHTEYWKEKTKDFIDFGQWDTESRPESFFENDFKGLNSREWVVFRPIDKDTELPMTMDRKSKRIKHVNTIENGKKIPVLDENGIQRVNKKGKLMFEEHTEIEYTRFISDVFLFIAPEGCIDTYDQIHELMSLAEARGAASAHRLVDIDTLIDEVNSTPEVFTDDLVYMVTEHEWLLTQFSEFIKSMFKQ